MQTSITFPLSSPPPYPGTSLTSGLNGAFLSMATFFSSGAAPTTATLGVSSLAGIPWHDTSTGDLNVRNQADTAWIFCGRFDETNTVFYSADSISPVSANTLVSGYTILATDRIVNINASGAVSGFFVTCPPSLYVSGYGITRTVNKVDTTTNNIYLTTDGTSGTVFTTISAAASATGSGIAVYGYRDLMWLDTSTIYAKGNG